MRQIILYHGIALAALLVSLSIPAGAELATFEWSREWRQVDMVEISPQLPGHALGGLVHIWGDEIEQVALIRFNEIPLPEGATIHSASLHLKSGSGHHLGKRNARSVAVHRMLVPWEARWASIPNPGNAWQFREWENLTDWSTRDGYHGWGKGVDKFTRGVHY